MDRFSLSILVAASSKKVMPSMEKNDLNCVFELYLWSYIDDLDIFISLQDYTKLLGCLDTFRSLGSNLNYLNFTQWESPSSIYMKIPTVSSPLIPIPFLLINFIWSRIKNLRWWMILSLFHWCLKNHMDNILASDCWSFDPFATSYFYLQPWKPKCK